MTTWPGFAHPLGATFDGQGTDFALFSESAERVELCLFDEDRAESRHEFQDVDAFVWLVYVPEAQVGQRYGFRVNGALDPASGQRHNASELLLDQYTRAIEGEVD